MCEFRKHDLMLWEIGIADGQGRGWDLGSGEWGIAFELLPGWGWIWRHPTFCAPNDLNRWIGIRENPPGGPVTPALVALVAPAGPDAAILTPDIGGALWVNRFRVIDLVRLIDRDLGLATNRNRSSLRDRLLHARQPAGVWLHGHWFQMAGFDNDPEFAAL